MPYWAWVSLGATAIAVALEELRMYRLRRESAKKEEIFQVVTENAADRLRWWTSRDGVCTTAHPTSEFWAIHRRS